MHLKRINNGCKRGVRRYTCEAADHLNTPRLITDNAVGVANRAVWQWGSDPFGITQPNENPAAAGVFTYNPRFPGQVLVQNWYSI